MADPTSPALRRTPLYDQHVALGAKTADFGGWDMPIEYAGAGVVAEHTSVRTAVGLFDVSHMGRVRVTGPGAVELLDGLLTNDLARIGPGRAQYTMLCDDTGGVIDDLIVYRRRDDDVFLIPNAANAATVVAAIEGAASAGLLVEDLQSALGIIAVQGPHSAALLTELGLPQDMPVMSFEDVEWRGWALTVARSGYTGEHGYELIAPASMLELLWEALLFSGASMGVQPCGLGARDTLRTEMGYPLHGQDLGPTISPVMARLGWAVGWDKPTFAGRDALVAQRQTGPGRLLRGLRGLDRAIPRPHMSVHADAASLPSGGVIGEVTSGTFSPTLRVGIGLALLDAAVSEGDEVLVDVRGRPGRFEVVRPPFVDASPRD